MFFIDVIGSKYSVVFDENLKDQNLYGITEPFTRTIKLSTELLQESDKVLLESTLRHEMIHAMLWEAGHEKYYQDERLVVALEILFPKFYETNKKILGKLNKFLKIQKNKEQK